MTSWVPVSAIWWRRNSPLSAVLIGTLTARSLLMASLKTTAYILLSSMVSTVSPGFTPKAASA